MDYEKILKNIAEREGLSPRDVENQMALALKAAGISCSVKKFIKKVSNDVKSRL